MKALWFGKMMLGACAASLAASVSSWAAEITIGVTPSPLSLPVDVAQTQGFFAAEGIVVRLAVCTTGPRCMQSLFDDTVQLAAATDMPVVTHSFGRSDFAVVATMATSNGNIRLIGRKSAGVTAAEQLVGKRIGVMVGTSAQYYLDSFLYFHGIDPKQVQVVALLPEAIPAAMANRQVDALAGYSRHTGPALKALGADGVLLSNPRIYTETYNLVIGRQTLAQRPGDVIKILRALHRAENFIADNPQQAKAIMMDRAKLDRDFVDGIFQSFTYRLSLDQSLVSTMEGVARWARRGGHVAGDAKVPNYLDFVEAGPLRTAVPTALSK